jgi:tetratricopeptide (TPR) repeat protein
MKVRRGMIDQTKASKLAREAFDLWQAGQLAQSQLLYEEAISLADPQHWGLSGYHGEFACVLNELGAHEQATAQLEKSLAADLAQANEEGSSALIIARYFLAEQLLRNDAPERALETLLPSILHAPNDWLTRFIEAQVLFALNRNREAIEAAKLAVSNAPTTQKAQELSLGLAKILGVQDV